MVWQSKRHPLVLLIQGPSNPWWLAPVLAVAGLVIAGASLAGWPAAWAIVGVCVGVPPLVVGGVWLCARLSEWQYYKSLAAGHDWSVCPICGYDLSGADPSRCPECGRDLAGLKGTLESKRDTLF